ncbi:NPP1 family protein [Streptomyces sp. NPDC004539]|uniref:NPP1 family protein n=1 Tax=Streptomyces sp. NPDC004539 TaxID=3154280 RepID=UPI0033A88360
MLQARKIKRRSRLAKAALAFGSTVALTVGLAGSAAAAPNLSPLPWSATSFQTTFMPYFDYDSDGCFPASAIDMWGNVNGGLKPTGAVGGGCRTDHLANANTYGRAKCNNGWCGILYGMYFEKDQVSPGIGHRHDWESVVVWVRQGASKPSYLAASRHGGFSVHPVNEVPMDGVHVKIVYHKDGAGSHAFRFAKWDERPEAWGPNGGWDTPALVSWDHFPRSNDPSKNLQDLLNRKDWGDRVNCPVQDSKFNGELNKAKPGGIPFNPWA